MARYGILFGIVAMGVVISATAGAQEPLVAARAEAAEQARSDAGAQSAYGWALLRAGRYREAERAFRKAAQLDRGSLERLFDVARAAFARGDYRASLAACRPLQSKSRNGVLTRVCRARAYLVWNRSARAFEELEAALLEDPTHFEALLALGDAHVLRADAQEAIEAYEKASQARPNSAEPFLGLGRTHASSNQREQAIAALRRALALDAESPVIQYELGRLLGSQREALELLEKAVAGQPDWVEARVALGYAVLQAGNAQQAVEHFRRAVAQNDELAPAHAGLGQSLLELGQFSDAEQCLGKALELVPNSPAAALALADLYTRTDRNEEAFEQYRVAADLDPSSAAPLLRASALGVRLGRDVLAAGFLDRLLDQHRNLAPALVLYGDIMAQRHERDAALEYYQRALNGQGNIDRAAVERKIAQVRQTEPQRSRGRLGR